MCQPAERDAEEPGRELGSNAGKFRNLPDSSQTQILLALSLV